MGRSLRVLGMGLGCLGLRVLLVVVGRGEVVEEGEERILSVKLRFGVGVWLLGGREVG